MTRSVTFVPRASAARVALALPLLAMLLPGTVLAQNAPLKLNDREYFEKRGLNVLVFSNQYDGMFFDEKTAGIELIHHGVRTATGGAVRLKPTPEQWDQIPKVVEGSRKVDRTKNTIEVVLRYDDFDFNSRLVVTPDSDGGFLMTVYLDKPLPEKLEGRAGLNLEFLPSAYFEKTYLMDGKPGIVPRYPSGPMQVKPADTQIRQFGGHSTFDDHGRKEYVEADPIAAGKTLVLAPEDPERRVTMTTASGDLMLLDGRNVAQNGWLVVRTLIPAKATGKVAEWSVRPNAIQNWTRTPVIGFSQAGYHPGQKKVGVIELDPNDRPLDTASVFQVMPDGTAVEKLKAQVQPWTGRFLRYSYATFDFSAVDQTGVYYVQYGSQKTETFPIGPQVYQDVWYKTLDVWFPVQMDHMFVNEAYRVWHGAAHLDDARQAPINWQHFDGYRQGPSTETKYKPGEHIPGLNIGGWFDAGDYDIRTGSHASTVMHMVDTWERFHPKRDETLVDQATRYVDIHHPDGKPDLLQQIEHGALALIAQHRAFGRAIPGIIEPNLHQYHHLGDGSTQTDGRLYDPSLKPYEIVGDRSGTADDRWAFTSRPPNGLPDSNNYASAAALAAASRALRGYNDALADECLAAAKKQWSDERQVAATAPPPARPQAMFGRGGDLTATLQLLIATKEKIYVDRFNEAIWPALGASPEMAIRPAVQALPYFDAAYKKRLDPYVGKYKEQMDGLLRQNPYGVPITTRGWAGNQGVISWSVTNYYLHKAYPDLIGPEYVLRGLTYIFGTHPASNVSFVSTVGTRSKKIAYGNNRADFTFIAGGVVPGILVLKPDFPENKEDWPFLWGENEYVIDICADYILLANAVNDLLDHPQVATVPAPVDMSAAQDHQRTMDLLGMKSIRPGADPRNPKAPNPVNYDEAKAGPSTPLPDPLVLKNGKKVTSGEGWWKTRRPQIVEDFDKEIYGRVPKGTPPVRWAVTSTTEEKAGAVSVVTKRLIGHADNSAYPAISVDIDFTVTTPANAPGPVPLMIEFGFSLPPGMMAGPRPPGPQPAGPTWQEQLIAKGWGYAILSPASIQADNGAGLTRGIIGLVNKGQPRKLDDWGALRAWAWGASRALDYLETDKAVDAKHVGIEGVSRYGKAALVTMAYDQRFAFAFVASSGEGGAKLHRRHFGELVENVAGTGEYHWMAGNFLKYAGPLSDKDLPVDSHELIALCAPRPVFISAGSPQLEGEWIDAKGSFLAAVAAGPVYRLLGKKGLSATEFPPIETALIDGDIAFRQHKGGHTAGPNWPTFLTFAERYVKAPKTTTSTSTPAGAELARPSKAISR